MKQLVSARGKAYRAAGLLAACALTAFTAEAAKSAPATAEEWAQGLCEVIEEGVRLLTENRMAPSNGEMKRALLEAMIRSSDPTVLFLTETELAARQSQQVLPRWESGLTVVAMPNGLPKVAAVRPGSPAAAAGILPGDQLEKIGGREIPVGPALAPVRQQLGGGEDAKLDVVLRGADGKSRTVTIERTAYPAAAPAVAELLPAGMGYLQVPGVVPGMAKEIETALDIWRTQKMIGGILDLRGAGGEAEEEVAAIAAHFAPAGPYLYLWSNRQGGDRQTVKGDPRSPCRVPLMVLVDEETSRAAELLAAVLGGSVKGAMIIGRPTAGDPLLREPVALPTGGYALLARRQLQTANGSVYTGRDGLQPDVIITDAALAETVYEPEAPLLRKNRPLTDEEKEDKALRDRTRHDTYLRRATDVLLGLAALGYGKN